MKDAYPYIKDGRLCVSTHATHLVGSALSDVYFSFAGGMSALVGPQFKNMASIMRGYKIGVTKNARKINPKWQARYHDHIIRNEKPFYRIQNYIKNNPTNWKEDKFHSFR